MPISACSLMGSCAARYPLERMTALMRDDIHITAGTVEIGEDKRCMVERQIGHVTACLLRLASQDIK